MQPNVPFDSRTYLVPASSRIELSVWMRGTSLDVATSSSIISQILVGQCIQYPNDQCQNNTISLIRPGQCSGKNVPKCHANGLIYSGTRIQQRKNRISIQKQNKKKCNFLHSWRERTIQKTWRGTSFLNIFCIETEGTE